MLLLEKLYNTEGNCLLKVTKLTKDFIYTIEKANKEYKESEVPNLTDFLILADGFESFLIKIEDTENSDFDKIKSFLKTTLTGIVLEEDFDKLKKYSNEDIKLGTNYISVCNGFYSIYKKNGDVYENKGYLSMNLLKNPQKVLFTKVENKYGSYLLMMKYDKEAKERIQEAQKTISNIIGGEKLVLVGNMFDFNIFSQDNDNEFIKDMFDKVDMSDVIEVLSEYQYNKLKGYENTYQSIKVSISLKDCIISVLKCGEEFVSEIKLDFLEAEEQEYFLQDILERLQRSNINYIPQIEEDAVDRAVEKEYQNEQREGNFDFEVEGDWDTNLFLQEEQELEVRLAGNYFVNGELNRSYDNGGYDNPSYDNVKVTKYHTEVDIDLICAKDIELCICDLVSDKGRELWKEIESTIERKINI